MSKKPQIIVLVHGWSVHNTSTYGELRKRLKREAQAGRIGPVKITNIWLGKYVSFKDEVRMEDLSRAFGAALQDNLGVDLKAGRRFACITHSTGGPLVRDWWQNWDAKDGPCPMSHLIMLAPANFGSALAQLGKGTVSRLKSWANGVEPGQGVLDWLELGSEEAWNLNQAWIEDETDSRSAPDPVFPFVLTGQTIDRKLYDHVNSYTGELGSDGVVRVAAANLNATYVKLVQQEPVEKNNKWQAPKLVQRLTKRKTGIAFALIEGKAHSGESKGILNSIKDNKSVHKTVTAICRCLNVQTEKQYDSLVAAFNAQNKVVYEKERAEKYARRMAPDSHFIHDAKAMVIMRIRDDCGHPITDFDLRLTGARGNPNYLPHGFFVDRQRNSRDHNTITYFLNYDLMEGSKQVSEKPDKKTGRKKTLRQKTNGAEELGLKIDARPDKGFVHYMHGEVAAALKNLDGLLWRNETTMLDIELRRIVHTGVFKLENKAAGDEFKDQETGPPILKKERS